LRQQPKLLALHQTANILGPSPEQHLQYQPGRQGLTQRRDKETAETHRHDQFLQQAG
jgi:hypothetical protein